jgi:hypothetical protein
MGRLHHLSHTLPANLANTSSYADREFIILNYGSKDGLHEWVRDNLKPWIDQGIVKYFRTKEPQYFVATHAKNIAHRQATGDILCNLDADNYLIQGYPEYLAETLVREPCVVAAPSADMFGKPGSCGKIAVLRDHFYSVNGYDEGQNLGWGWDDTNFQFRVRMHNNLKLIGSDKKWSLVIEHSNEERGRNFRDTDVVKTQDISIKRLEAVAAAQDYVANKGQNWGYAADLSSNL